ncbi:MAG: hypothetical protein ED556_01260 [Winogradskyella sp.]|uniref:hypothetical protein n=1 Tax=Winogradskyella sp. TaxID=1883156 RepID=UPI000F3C4B16|nr:hypothetical protein [Winogradskyella sp.]RNC87847.1 MAG: hypothetical protein ED556_01260 [Winogradskyella sp.]
MEKHYEFTDDEFEQAFISCSLNPSCFSHEAHLRLAWINIRKYGIENALKNIQNQLQRFVEFVGAKDKYNKTLTIAATLAVNHFMNTADAKSFKVFITQFPRLKTNFKELMAFHYSFDIYNSDRAKTKFLEPDLEPFDSAINLQQM